MMYSTEERISIISVCLFSMNNVLKPWKWCKAYTTNAILKTSKFQQTQSIHYPQNWKIVQTDDYSKPVAPETSISVRQRLFIDFIVTYTEWVTSAIIAYDWMGF